MKRLPLSVRKVFMMKQHNYCRKFLIMLENVQHAFSAMAYNPRRRWGITALP